MNVGNCDNCPAAVALLNALPVCDSAFGYAYFSVLAPGTTIAPHHGPTNVKLRVQLADKADGSYEYQSYEYGEDEAPPATAGVGWRPSQPGGRPSIGPQPLDLGIAGAVMAVVAAGAMLWTRLRRAAYETIGDGSVAAARESEALELANTFRSP